MKSNFYIIYKNSEQLTKLLNEASELCDDYVFYNNIWDMEPCFEKYKVNWKDWENSVNGDPEWVFMLARFGFLSKLLIAFYFTNNKIYLDKWDKIYSMYCQYSNKNHIGYAPLFLKIRRKINYHFPQIIKEDFSNRPLDVALRIVALKDRLEFKCDNVDIIQREIYLSCRYIITMFNEWHSKSNWGLIMALSVLYVSDVAKNEQFELWAKNEIDKMIKIQYFKDGMHIECCPMYAVQIHILMLKILLKCEDQLDLTLYKNLHKTSTQIAKFIDNISIDGFLPQIGDTDYCEVNSILNISNSVLNKCQCNKEIDLESAFAFKEIFDYKDFLENRNSTKSSLYSYCGISRLKLGNFDIITTNGPCNGGHEHFDSGSFLFYYNKTPFIIDPGRYTYLNNSLREYLRSELAHNTFIIDSTPMACGRGSWAVSNRPEFYNNSFIRINKSVMGIQMSYGYKNKIYHRCIVKIADDAVAIISWIYYMGTHQCSEYYHFDEKVKLTSISDKICINDALFITSLLDVDYHINEYKQSYLYNEFHLSNVLEIHKCFDSIYLNGIILSEHNNYSIEKPHKNQLKIIKNLKPYIEIIVFDGQKNCFFCTYL